MTAIRVSLPPHLRRLAGVGEEVTVQVEGRPTPNSVLDALEGIYPMLQGTIREHGLRRRRAYLRYFADGEDISHDDPDQPLPEAIVAGREPFIVIGAISGG
ncbi:MAG TPA: MoaD/ThiS family protein [Longimicrobiaceae bacterium]